MTERWIKHSKKNWKYEKFQEKWKFFKEKQNFDISKIIEKNWKIEKKLKNLVEKWNKLKENRKKFENTKVQRIENFQTNFKISKKNKKFTLKNDKNSKKR